MVINVIITLMINENAPPIRKQKLRTALPYSKHGDDMILLPEAWMASKMLGKGGGGGEGGEGGEGGNGGNGVGVRRRRAICKQHDPHNLSLTQMWR